MNLCIPPRCRPARMQASAVRLTSHMRAGAAMPTTCSWMYSRHRRSRHRQPASRPPSPWSRLQPQRRSRWCALLLATACMTCSPPAARRTPYTVHNLCLPRKPSHGDRSRALTRCGWLLAPPEQNSAAACTIDCSSSDTVSGTAHTALPTDGVPTAGQMITLVNVVRSGRLQYTRAAQGH